jgi:hypothetical protein
MFDWRATAMLPKIRPAGQNPIARDILVILAMSLLAAMALVSIGGVLLSEVF